MRAMAGFLSASLCTLACSATATRAQVQADAARRLECAEQQVSVENEGAHALRASGCGRSLIYVCDEAEPGPIAPQSTMTAEHEARIGSGSFGRCKTWSPE